MPIIPVVGRRAPKVRLTIMWIYAVLSIGAPSLVAVARGINERHGLDRDLRVSVGCNLLLKGEVYVPAILLNGGNRVLFHLEKAHARTGNRLCELHCYHCPGHGYRPCDPWRDAVSCLDGAELAPVTCKVVDVP